MNAYKTKNININKMSHCELKKFRSELFPSKINYKLLGAFNDSTHLYKCQYK